MLNYSGFISSKNHPPSGIFYLHGRIIINYNPEDISKEEGRYYIFEKPGGASCNQAIFKAAAIEAVLNAADK